MDNKIKILLFSPFALAILLVVAANYIPVTSELPGIASAVSRFTPSGLMIKEKQKTYSGPELKIPMDFAAAPPSSPEALQDKGPRPDDFNDRSLSLIVVSDTGRMAVINGIPVKEGDKIADINIVKIERDRVLLKDTTMKWLHLER